MHSYSGGYRHQRRWSASVARATGSAFARNPRFVRELEARLTKDGGKEAVVLPRSDGWRFHGQPWGQG